VIPNVFFVYVLELRDDLGPQQDDKRHGLDAEQEHHHRGKGAVDQVHEGIRLVIPDDDAAGDFPQDRGRQPPMSACRKVVGPTGRTM